MKSYGRNFEVEVNNKIKSSESAAFLFYYGVLELMVKI